MSTILLISGKAGSGKDTFADIFKKTKKNTVIYHFADALKAWAKDEESIIILLKEGFYKKAKGNKTQALDTFKAFLFEEYKANKGYKLWDGIKDSLGRKFLQLLGDACKEIYGETIFAEITFDRIKESSGKYLLVPDTRFPYEINHVRKNAKKKYDVVTVRIERPNFDNELGENGKHLSEVALDNFRFKHKLFNDSGIKDFEEKILKFIGEEFK